MLAWVESAAQCAARVLLAAKTDGVPHDDKETRPVTIRRVWSVAGVALLALTVLIGAATEARAYNGNIMGMMWDCEKAQASGNWGRAKKLVSIALLHLKDEGFTRTERALEKLSELPPNADDAEKRFAEVEKAFLTLRLEWLVSLRDENLWWKDELAKPDAGVLGASRQEIQRKMAAVAACLTPECQATQLELESADFEQAHALRVQALGLWQAEVDEVSNRLRRAESEATGEGAEEAAGARAEYLRRWLQKATRYTEALGREVAAEVDPAFLVGRMRYYEAKRQLGQRIKDEAFGSPIIELYRQKAAWAAAKAGVDVPADIEMGAPEWYCASVMEPSWFQFKWTLPVVATAP